MLHSELVHLFLITALIIISFTTREQSWVYFPASEQCILGIFIHSVAARGSAEKSEWSLSPSSLNINIVQHCCVFVRPWMTVSTLLFIYPLLIALLWWLCRFLKFALWSYLRLALLLFDWQLIRVGTWRSILCLQHNFYNFDLPIQVHIKLWSSLHLIMVLFTSWCVICSSLFSTSWWLLLEHMSSRGATILCPSVVCSSS